MIASVTFTYQDNSNNREELFYYRSKDQAYNLFKSKLDYNLYIFHNCQKAYAKNIVEKYLQHPNNHSYILWDSYPKAFEFALNYLKDIGVTKIVFIQDDVFSCDESLGASWKYNSNQALCSYEELAHYLKRTELNYINLEVFDKEALVLEHLGNFNVLNTNTEFFRSKKLWSFDDSSYYAKIDYALNHIYDQDYYSKSNIWEAEFYLKTKFDKLNVDQYVTTEPFFKRFYLVGPNGPRYREGYLSRINKIMSL